MKWLLLLLVLVSACVVDSGETKDFVDEGRDGIKINFLEGMPANKLYEGSPLQVIVEIRNKGKYNEPYGKILLYGFDKSILQFDSIVPIGTTPAQSTASVQPSNPANPAVPTASSIPTDEIQKQFPKLMAKSKLLEEGGYDTVSFDSRAINLQYEQPYKPNLILSACYHYKTIAAPTICVMRGSSLNLKNLACKPKTTTMKGQGAPVAITKLEQEVVGDFINFVISFENDGGGVLIAPEQDSYNSCPFRLQEKDIDKVKLTIAIRDLPEPTCLPANEIRLIDGKGTVQCSFMVPEGTAPYPAQMNIELDYHYHTKTEKLVEIIPLKT